VPSLFFNPKNSLYSHTEIKLEDEDGNESLFSKRPSVDKKLKPTLTLTQI
jgi:uncharacterized protein YrzB (UPF0473 family)